MKLSNFFGGSTPESMMRLCVLICTLTACGCAIAIIVLNRDMATGAALITSILTPALLGKAVQKFGEREVPPQITVTKTIPGEQK